MQPQSREKATKEKLNGALVQLVRIHACHAWGHGFESRTHREKILVHFESGFFISYKWKNKKNGNMAQFENLGELVKNGSV